MQTLSSWSNHLTYLTFCQMVHAPRTRCNTRVTRIRAPKRHNRFWQTSQQGSGATMNAAPENHRHSLRRDHITHRNHHQQANVRQEYVCMPSVLLPLEALRAKCRCWFPYTPAEDRILTLAIGKRPNRQSENCCPPTYMFKKMESHYTYGFVSYFFYYVPWTCQPI